MSSLDSHREDTLWSKFNEIKAVLRESRKAGKNPVKFSTGVGGANPGQTVVNTYSAVEPPRYDDSGRFVDMTQVYEGIFIGGEYVSVFTMAYTPLIRDFLSAMVFYSILLQLNLIQG